MTPRYDDGEDVVSDLVPAGGRHANREELLSRISIDPTVCFGKPCIRGHRIWASLILDLLASGTKLSEILVEYPGLAQEDILACIAYGRRGNPA